MGETMKHTIININEQVIQQLLTDKVMDLKHILGISYFDGYQHYRTAIQSFPELPIELLTNNVRSLHSITMKRMD